MCIDKDDINAINNNRTVEKLQRPSWDDQWEFEKLSYNKTYVSTIHQYTYGSFHRRLRQWVLNITKIYYEMRSQIYLIFALVTVLRRVAALISWPLIKFNKYLTQYPWGTSSSETEFHIHSMMTGKIEIRTVKYMGFNLLYCQ